MECVEWRLPEALRLGEAAEVALEDYAREVTRSQAAEAVREAPDGPLVALRLLGLAREPDASARSDVFAFARELEAPSAGAGLGWA